MSDDSTVPEAIQEQPPEATDTAPVASGSSNESPTENPPSQGTLAPGGGPDPAPKRKAAGRPHGAKDRVPRTRRPAVGVLVEPLATPETGSNVDNRVSPPPQPHVPTPIPVEEPPPSPPPSPRSMLRETARHMVALRSMVDHQRRVKIHEEFTSKLLHWPIG